MATQHGVFTALQMIEDEGFRNQVGQDGGDAALPIGPGFGEQVGQCASIAAAGAAQGGFFGVGVKLKSLARHALRQAHAGHQVAQQTLVHLPGLGQFAQPLVFFAGDGVGQVGAAQGERVGAAVFAHGQGRHHQEQRVAAPA